MAGAGSALVAGQGGFVRGAAGADRQPAAASRAGESNRQRLRRSPDRHVRGDPRHHVDLVVEQHRPLGIGFGRWIGNELKPRARQIEIQLSAGVLDDWAQLHELRDQRPQPARSGEARVG